VTGGDTIGDVKFLHAWFEWFRHHSVNSVYRLIAVVAGSAVTAVVFGLLLSYLVSKPATVMVLSQLPLALAAWALLGKIEGDDRDRAFGQPQPPTPGVREPRRPRPSSPASSAYLPTGSPHRTP
jgi:hypothetical protein